MKAILVMDMPHDCVYCPCWRGKNDEFPFDDCTAMQRPLTVDERDNKPDWCPLKPIPKGLVYKGYDSPNEQIGEAILKSEWGKKAKKNDVICIRSFSIGYNSCLEEIAK